MIKSSVGKGGVNKKKDVTLVQELLNNYQSTQAKVYFKKLKEDGAVGKNTLYAIKIFQVHVVGLAHPDCRIDAAGKTMKYLQCYSSSLLPSSTIISTILAFIAKHANNQTPVKKSEQIKQPQKLASANDKTDPRKLKTRQEIAQVYGVISADKIWADKTKYYKPFAIPQNITSHKDYNWINVYDPKKRKVTKIWCNSSMHSFLAKALQNLYANNLLSELKEYGGTHCIRATRGTTHWSAHSWALALDLNMSENGLGKTPKLSKEFVKCFTDAGFGWGGYYSRKDGMHFTLAGFDMPKKSQ